MDYFHWNWIASLRKYSTKFGILLVALGIEYSSKNYDDKQSRHLWNVECDAWLNFYVTYPCVDWNRWHWIQLWRTKFWLKFKLNLLGALHTFPSARRFGAFIPRNGFLCNFLVNIAYFRTYSLIQNIIESNPDQFIDKMSTLNVVETNLFHIGFKYASFRLWFFWTFYVNIFL